MPTHSYFSTLVYTAALQSRGARVLNARLLEECRQLRADDASGRRWSAANYPGGYTSYASAHRLQRLSPTFAELERKLERHVQAFAAAAEWDLAGRPLSMTDCWVNIMPRRTAHPGHLHPLSTLSGTYYVETPSGSPGLKFEDPRLERFMAAPPRKPRASLANKAWITVPAKAGHVILFESWLRHEVATNSQAGERVSVSFNYNWF
jgi:uncharacterized protein (TIGR02466 family)